MLPFRWRSYFFVSLFGYLLTICSLLHFSFLSSAKSISELDIFDLYVFVIINRFCWCYPLPLGNNRIIDVNHLWIEFVFIRTIDVIVWYSRIVLSPKSGFSSEYWVSSGLSRLWGIDCYIHWFSEEYYLTLMDFFCQILSSYEFPYRDSPYSIVKLWRPRVGVVMNFNIVSWFDHDGT